MESADRNGKDLQKTLLPAVNAISPLVKPYSRARPSATPHTYKSCRMLLLQWTSLCHRMLA